MIVPVEVMRARSQLEVCSWVKMVEKFVEVASRPALTFQVSAVKLGHGSFPVGREVGKCMVKDGGSPVGGVSCPLGKLAAWLAYQERVSGVRPLGSCLGMRWWMWLVDSLHHVGVSVGEYVVSSQDS